MDDPNSPASGTIEHDDFRILGAAARSENLVEAAGRGAERCTICLDSISERAVAVPCNHLTFDFLCLVSWLQEQPSCPLCKAFVIAVQYDWRASDVFKTYYVPRRDTNIHRSDGQTSRASSTPPRQSSQRLHHPASRLADNHALHMSDTILSQRRNVYRNNLYSLHIGSNPVSRYRDFTPQAFVSSPEMQSRAKTFLRRELQVFPYLNALTRRNDREFFVQYFLAILRKYEVKGADGKAEELVERFLGKENARLILHELESWLRSPFDRLASWDRSVQYSAVSNEQKQRR